MEHTKELGVVFYNDGKIGRLYKLLDGRTATTVEDCPESLKLLVPSIVQLHAQERV